MTALALHGGTPVRTKLFPRHNTIGEEEQRAVRDVLASGVLSQFLGVWHKHFYGGPQVRHLEEEWARLVGARHAIAVNARSSRRVMPRFPVSPATTPGDVSPPGQKITKCRGGLWRFHADGDGIPPADVILRSAGEARLVTAAVPPGARPWPHKPTTRR